MWLLRIRLLTWRYWGDKWHHGTWCIILISALAANVNNTTCELQIPGSTKGFGGGGDMYFVYRRIYGELLLIFVLYFNCEIFLNNDFFSSPPSCAVFEGEKIAQWELSELPFKSFSALTTTLKLCIFLWTRSVLCFTIACTLISFSRLRRTHESVRAFKYICK